MRQRYFYKSWQRWNWWTHPSSTSAETQTV